MEDLLHEDTEGAGGTEERKAMSESTWILVTWALFSLCGLGASGQHSFTQRSTHRHLLLYGPVLDPPAKAPGDQARHQSPPTKFTINGKGQQH